MAKRQVDAGIVGRLFGTLAIDAERFIEIADGQVLVGIEHVGLRVVRILLPQQRSLFERLGELLSFLQRADIVEPRTDIVRVELDSRFEQEFRFVVDVETHPDLGKQTHAFDVVAIGLEEMATELLGLVHLAFLDQAGNRQQLGRQRGKILDLRFGEFGGCLAPGLRVKSHQHLPATQQGVVARDSFLICGQGTRKVAPIAQAMRQLLMGAAIGGIERDQVAAERECLVKLFLQPPRNRQSIQRIPVLRLGMQQFLAYARRILDPPALQERSRLADQCRAVPLGFHRVIHRRLSLDEC